MIDMETFIRGMISIGCTPEQIAKGVAYVQQHSSSDGHLNHKDILRAEKRREWDRERKRKAKTSKPGAIQ